jgi:hypothetical protein
MQTQGLAGLEWLQYTAVVELVDRYDEQTSFTAMERTTGRDAAIVADGFHFPRRARSCPAKEGSSFLNSGADWPRCCPGCRLDGCQRPPDSGGR